VASSRGYVIVVEDEPEILDLFQDILASEDYRFLGFNHPYQLTNLTTRADLFLIDIMLPALNGLTVARELKSNGYARTPMIATSASDRLLTQAKQSGLFAATVPKPFDVQDLLSLVAAHIRA